MRKFEIEPQLSLVKDLYKRDTMEEQVTEMLLSNLSNIRYARDQVELSLIPLEVLVPAVNNYNEVLRDLAGLSYWSSRYLPQYKTQTKKDFEKRTISRNDLGLSETRSLEELYELTIAVRSRLKTALNRFETVCGAGHAEKIDKILKKLLDTAYLFDVV